MHELFKALSSESRVRILGLLAELRRAKRDVSCCGPDEICVCKITQRVDLAPSTVSHHLHELKDAGLIECRREGKWIYVSLNDEKLAEAESYIAGLRRAPAASKEEVACS
ncbi:MAG: ArsR family transcriptional regulator [Actinobacteria bacterium]|nr:MAG: ArsR family transcriptional regulator [Actinomycetota bacterium]